jgi:hypothetical protein
VEEGGSESWEDGVGEEIDVEDWQKELGGGQTDPVKSPVQREGETQILRGDLLLARRI